MFGMDGGVVSAPGAGPTPVPPRDAGANPTWALAVAAIYTLLALLLLPAALVGWRRLSKASDPAAAEDGALGSEEEEQAEPAAPPVPGPEAPDAGPAPAPPALPPLKLPPAVLYSSTAQTFVIGFKVAPLPAAMPGGSPPSEGGAEGAPPSPPSQPADSAALREAAALAANHLCGQAFAASAASVRNAAAAALVSVLQQNQLSVVNVQASTFPGCVHLVVSLQLPAGSDGSGRAVTPAPDAQQHLQRQLHAALQHQLSGAYKATISTPAGGAQQQLPYLHPVALPTTTTSDASSSSRVELVLPSSLIDQMRSAGQRLRVVVTPAVTAARLPAGRSQAWAQDLQPAAAAAAPQTDQRVDATFAAADAAPGPTASTVRVAVQVPASLRARVGGGSAQPLLQVHVLLRGEAGEQLLAQLPLPVLPPAACSELQLLFADMTAEMGGEAGSAHAASFAPLARDLALTQQPPQAGEAATAARPAAPSEAKAQQLRLAIIRGLLRFLTEQQRAAPACVQLAADAAQRYGLHHASLQAALDRERQQLPAAVRAEEGAPPALGQAAQGAPPPPAVVRTGEEQPPATAQPEEGQPPDAKGGAEGKQQGAAGSRGAGSSSRDAGARGAAMSAAAAAAGAAAAAVAQQLSAYSQGRHGLLMATACGFRPWSLENKYWMYKAVTLGHWHMAGAVVRLFMYTAAHVKFERLAAGLPGGGVAMMVMRPYHILAMAPAIVHLFAAPFYLAYREPLEAGSRLLCFSLLPFLWHPAVYSVGAAVQTAAYSRPLTVLVWGHLALPILQRLSLPLHVPCAAVRILQDVVAFQPMLLEGAYPLRKLCLAWAACVLGALGFVGACEWRQRGAFMAAALAGADAGGGGVGAAGVVAARAARTG